ncbi:MAG TPA: HAMP domain-containing sensor histidine kinase [Bacteroidota bacterium]|nr:HAMP domain-containing sensor histidine kinase [Bacteroidota bacterium]
MTIKTRISLLSTFVFGLLLSCFAILTYRAVRNIEIAKLDDRLELQGEKIDAEFEEEGGKNPGRVMEIFFSEKPEGMEGVTLRLFNPDGMAVLDDSLLDKSSSKPLGDALKGIHTKSFFSYRDANYRVLWMPLIVEGKTLYALQLGMSTSSMQRNLASIQMLFLITIPLTLLFTALGSVLITRIAFRPITRMVDAARQISAQNLDTRLELPNARDEIRGLAETLNGMIERIDAAFKSQKQFIADASHEIRTPLTIIANELEFAEKHAADKTLLESVQVSLGEIERLATMAQQMLLLARLDSSAEILHQEPVRLDELLIECVQRTKTLASKKEVEVRTTVEEALEISADREKMKSVIVNLLDNAIKYSPTRSFIVAKVWLKEGTENKAMIEIGDHGCGISQHDLPNIFKRFYRADVTRAEVGGSGLGLAIAEQIVTLHGGSIFVRSEAGHGSVFTVELPIDG